MIGIATAASNARMRAVPIPFDLLAAIHPDTMPIVAPKRDRPISNAISFGVILFSVIFWVIQRQRARTPISEVERRSRV